MKEPNTKREGNLEKSKGCAPSVAANLSLGKSRGRAERQDKGQTIAPSARSILVRARKANGRKRSRGGQFEHIPTLVANGKSARRLLRKKRYYYL
jgi:hypothetical protein